jgi:hypothetical protein
MCAGADRGSDVGTVTVRGFDQLSEFLTITRAITEQALEINLLQTGMEIASSKLLL